MNFAYVRSAIPVILASLALGLAAAPPADAAAPGPSEGDGEPTVTIALLPGGTGLASLGAVEGLAPGLLSAGIGRVPAAQTYLDVTQGNRVSPSLYDGDLPFPLRFDRRGVRGEAWQQVLARADGAPASIVPGLLASTLEAAGRQACAERAAGLGRLLAANREGRVDPLGGDERCEGLRVIAAAPSELQRLAEDVRPGALLIALERPPPAFRTLTIGIAGEGHEGLLTSESTRTDGLVAATDIAPTVLEHLGVGVPGEMNGQAIGSSEDGDVEGLRQLAQRLEVTGARRGSVVGPTLLAWLGLVGLAALAFRRPGARVALTLLALSVVYLALVLLATPLLDPSLWLERLVAGLAPPLLAVATWRLAPGWPGLAFACLATVAAYAADVVAGSVLVPLSIPGPNPASGSRFYGIGNEIEATVAALLPLGVGALLASLGPTRDGGRAAAATFLAAGIVAAAAFSLGRFGADVGAAIVLPVGAAVAAAVALGNRRGVLLAVGVPILCLCALMAIDLILGGGAHLTRSLLDAGGLSEAGDVFERRIRLAASSFTHGPNLPFLALAALAIAAGVRWRHRIRSWLCERAALAGFAGAVAAAVVGAVSNDSGALLLILGIGFATAAVGYAWALRSRPPADSTPPARRPQPRRPLPGAEGPALT